MTLRQYLTLFILGFVVILVTASFQNSPGYMDADYYYSAGERLAKGEGFTEPFLWNYLDDPNGIPHPSFAYWMPLASFVAFAGMKISGILQFNTARSGFLLLGAFLPPITASLAFSFTNNQQDGILAGLLAALPGFYLPFLTTTDTFSIYMVLGGLFFLVLARAARIKSLNIPFALSFYLGLLAGLMHLARAEGILWLLLAFFGIYLLPKLDEKSVLLDKVARKTPGRIIIPGNSRLINLAILLLGYLLVMAPWLVRNVMIFGTPFSPGGSRVLWLTHYDELFAYPASMLTPVRWWQSGLTEIIKARLWALGQNLQTILAVQGEIFLAPLVFAGMWQRRNDSRLQVGFMALILTLFVMTVIFPFAGSRGGLFHSGAAWQPLFWALVPIGLEIFLSWGERKRGWNKGQARKAFGVGIVLLAFLLTAAVTQRQLFAGDFPQRAWDQVEIFYQNIEADLRAEGIGSQDIVMVNNPPGYYVATDRSAIYTPFGDEQNVIAAARRYEAAYLLLEKNHPEGLNNLYNHPGDRPGLTYLFTSHDVHIFSVLDVK